MTKAGRLMLAFGAVGLVGIGACITVVLSAERNSNCPYSYIYADDTKLARRLIARDDDEWWRRAKFLPKAGVVDCETFRATIEYAVHTEQEHVTVEGNEEAYRKWREGMGNRKDTANPFWVDLRKWEKRR